MDYLQLIKDKEGESQELFNRMDDDRKKRYHLEEYKLKDFDNKEIPECDNVTTNDSAVFASRVIALLLSAHPQTVVEGKGMNDKATTLIENFLNDIDLAVDERLNRMGLISLDSFLYEQVTIRGRIAERRLMRMDGDNFIADVLPMDTRYLVYEMGTDGLIWSAYKTKRSKSMLEREYPELEGKIRGKALYVYDMWYEDRNIIFIDSKEFKNEENPLGYPPINIQISPLGSQLQDEDNLKHSGESIFWLDRGLYAEKNKAVTIDQSLARMALFPPLQKEFEDIASAEKPEKPVQAARQVIPVGKGELYHAMPIADIHNANRHAYNIIEGCIQRGSFTTVEYGNLTFPLSAVAISRLTENRDKILVPLIQTVSKFRQQGARMDIDQFVKGGITAELGEEGKKNKYKPSDLDGDYTIRFKYFATSPEQNIANYTIANAAGNVISDDTKRRDILKLENPDAEKQKILSELADKMVPSLALYKMAKAKLEVDEEIEAQLIANQLGITLEQLRTGKFEPEEKPREEVPPKPLMPLMGGGRGGRARQPEAAERSSAKEAAELEVQTEAE